LIIFSENYASSHWCLDELLKIFECKKKYGQIVIPVFYNVETTVVKRQTKIYENAFAEHNEKYSSSRVQNWRHTLKKSTKLTGIKLSDFQLVILFPTLNFLHFLVAFTSYIFIYFRNENYFSEYCYQNKNDLIVIILVLIIMVC
jgi:hypothetical protein